jgi:hypothetical protein
MTTNVDYSKSEAAALAAQEAMQAAQNAKDAAELEFLDACTSVKQINEGRTKEDATRLKSRYVAAFGFQRWQRLVADSRR